ncbi:phosphoribosyltransferase, partial [Leptolyngbya sp. FACHB-36]|uniref:phosphoribosyltransferase n=1 Tax=Leptolyngbya sp. FACHB-36 TaxID=2692808 RepID=UPI001680417F
GLPIASSVARVLGCPLDVVVAKKITQPENRELAIGAVTADGHVVWSTQRRRLPENPFNQYNAALQQAQEHAQAQLTRLAPPSRFSPEGAIAILVDDGIATGMTMAAAVRALRAQQPAQVWICAPVAPLDLMPFLHEISERAIVLATPHRFLSVSRFYREFLQVGTEEAAIYLQQQNN